MNCTLFSAAQQIMIRRYICIISDKDDHGDDTSCNFLMGKTDLSTVGDGPNTEEVLELAWQHLAPNSNVNETLTFLHNLHV